MENIFENQLVPVQHEQVPSTTANSFIHANTSAMDLAEIRDNHIIPVFPSSNEPLISHYQLIESMMDVTQRAFSTERVNQPVIRVSHPIKGRIPEAKHKKAHELQPWEETIYYERMMFMIEIPSVTTTIEGNVLNLSVGAVKAYNLDNIYTKRLTSAQQFKLFIGFQNKVCCNMCVSTDGFKLVTNIHSIDQLRYTMWCLLSSFKIEQEFDMLSNLTNHELSEKQFAQVMGRSRMFKHLPEGDRYGIPPILLGDQQLGAVVKAYYQDDNFNREKDGTLSMWKFHNLLTGANKQTYIDQFIDRAVNATDFTNELILDLSGVKNSWYMG